MAAKGSAASWMVAILVAAGAMAGARGDFASDQAECTEQLTALLPCLAFVEGTAPAPTPDCCGDAKVVVGRSLKCLCVLVKDRNEPGLGFKINITRAVTLPALCNVPANMSDCPKLLKLPAGSPEEKEFYEFEEQILQTIRAKTKSTSNLNATTTVSNNSDKAGKMWLKITRAVKACLLLLPALLLS